MICFVNLPNLRSITSVQFSFNAPRWVTLESISELWILIIFRYSKSSKYQVTSFIPWSSIEINFEYSLIDLISIVPRCFFDSRWSCPRNQPWLLFWCPFIISVLNLHTWFHFTQKSLCLFLLVLIPFLSYIFLIYIYFHSIYNNGWKKE